VSDTAVPGRLIILSRLYAIVDAGCFAGPGEAIVFAQDLAAGGCTLLQYRDKRGNARHILRQARQLRGVLPDSLKLILNDRADLCVAANFDGVHVGQDDLSPDGARIVVGQGSWVGVSTHNPEQVQEAERSSADYIAIGPVFPTSGKERPDPVLGLEGVRRARKLTTKPLVAIGGITAENCRSVIDSGADSIAVISSLLRAPRKSAEDFLRILR
jgi:thiamine-phosphate pyrophosphorylase